MQKWSLTVVEGPSDMWLHIFVGLSGIALLGVAIAGVVYRKSVISVVDDVRGKIAERLGSCRDDDYRTVVN